MFRFVFSLSSNPKFCCNSGGNCTKDGTCSCNKEWGGLSCERKRCPMGGEPKKTECSSRGLCVDGTCICPDELPGDACEPADEVKEESSIWSSLFRL